MIKWASICIKRGSLFCIFQVLNFSTPRQTVSCLSAWSKHISLRRQKLLQNNIRFSTLSVEKRFQDFIYLSYPLGSKICLINLLILLSQTELHIFSKSSYNLLCTLHLCDHYIMPGHPRALTTDIPTLCSPPGIITWSPAHHNIAI